MQVKGTDAIGSASTKKKTTTGTKSTTGSKGTTTTAQTTVQTAAQPAEQTNSSLTPGLTDGPGGYVENVETTDPSLVGKTASEIEALGPAYQAEYQAALANGGVYGGTGVTASSTGTASSGSTYDSALQSYKDALAELLEKQEEQEAASLKAIQAGKTQAIENIEAQKETTNQEYADTLRQLYLNKMADQKNIAQKMAALGQTGGQAESTMLGLNTAYEENLRQSENARSDALKDLEKAISDAELSASVEKANTIAENAQTNTNQYLTALQNLLSAASTKESLDSSNKSDAYNRAMTLLQYGIMPDDDTLSSAGITSDTASALLAKINASGSSSGGGSGTAEEEEGYTSEQIQAMLDAYSEGDMSVVPALKQATGMTASEIASYVKTQAETTAAKKAETIAQNDSSLRKDCAEIYTNCLSSGMKSADAKAQVRAYIYDQQAAGNISQDKATEVLATYKITKAEASK